MLTAITAFQLPHALSPEDARALFLSTAPRYRGVAGLFRKCYYLSEDGLTAGGIYLWRSRADADAVYTGAWRAQVQRAYGTPPSIRWFDSPVLVDNVVGEIVSDA